MLDLATEKEHLAKAESDIAEGERRITQQTELIERLRRDDHNVGEAETLLETLRQTLRTWQDHRDLILVTIARLEGGAAGPTPKSTGAA